MNEEAAFLASINAAPKEATPRLIYADWLEELGDFRSELVRIEEEMREIPVFADRYWLLKSRRNELRSESPKAWLKKMAYSTECSPTFVHGIPTGWKERWRLIREFTERWSGVPMPDIGGRSDEIREVAHHLRRKLPLSLCEWIAFTHDFREGLRDRFPLIEELFEHAAVSLLQQAEGDYHWTIRNDDLDFPDPPVYGYVLDYDHAPVKNLSAAFGDRFNVLTGDNGLGKSFLLDIAFWALTGAWPGGRVAIPQVNGKMRDPTIAFEFHGKNRNAKQSASFDYHSQSWRRPKGKLPMPGLVVYAAVDGGFAVWDPARNYWRNAPSKPLNAS